MANINSLMSSSSSNTSSLYGTRNVLSGLASGMDTEAMIENSVSGYKAKVTQLQQQQTKYEWKRDAYRSITDKLYEMNQKYTSYTSKTNLASNAFFTGAVSTTAVGPSDAVSKVSATGRSSSDIQILAAQAATAASYSVKADNLSLAKPDLTTENVTRSGSSIEVGTLKGSMTLTYDSQTIEITFDETDAGINASGGKTLAEAIEQKLSNVNINTTKNGVMKASDVIKVTANGGSLTFTENAAKNQQGATPYISYMSDSLKTSLGASQTDLFSGSSIKQYVISKGDAEFTENQSVQQYLEGRTINVTLDGVNKSFALSGLQVASNGKLTMESLKKAFEDGFQSIGANVGVAIDGSKLKFTPPNETSALSISAKDEKANELLGMTAGVGNYLNADASISNLLGSSFKFNDAQAATKADGVAVSSVTGNIYEDSDGNRYEKSGDTYYRVNDKNERLYELKINNKSVYVSANASFDSVLNEINGSDMGVTAAYSKLTRKLTLTAKEAGSASNISFDNALAQSLFTPTKTSDLTLGEVLPQDWFDADGAIRLFTASSATGTPIERTLTGGEAFTTDTTIDKFLKLFNGAYSYAQFADSSSTLKAKNKTDTFSGFDLEAKGVGAYEGKDETVAAKYRVTNSETGENSLTMQELVNRVKDAVAARNADIATYTKGTDAEVLASVNGETVKLQRSSNTIDLDGMTLTLKGSFGERDENGHVLMTDEAIETGKSNALSFTTSGGSEDLIKTIREFVDEYNSVMKQVYDAFATQPAEKSSSTHAKYEPLTDDDKSTMSETAIKNYEDKAKQGLLFGDSDLRALYQNLVNAISPGGSDGAALRSIGIETSYSSNLTQIKLNETKLREALESDPDKVRNAFTKSKEYGSSTNGLMSSIKNTMEHYASTSTASLGVLVKKAGSTFSSTSLLSNTVQKQIDSVQTQIEKWQTKMSSKIDYYTRQFTALEKLMNTMNSQSSALAGLMGGY